MSEYIARARVKIEPDTTGFQRTLSEKLKPILAKPFGVTVAPITTGFHTALRTKLANLKAVSVPVVPTKLEAFRAAIAAQSVPVEIPVVVNPEALRAQLAAAVATAEAGVVATVPVTLAGGAGAELAGLQTALSSLTAQMEKLTAAQLALGQSGKARDTVEKSLTKTETARDKIARSLVAGELALTDVENAALSIQERLNAASVAGVKLKSAYGAAVDLVAKESTAEANALLQSVRATQAKLAAEMGLIEALQEEAKTQKTAIALEEKLQATIARSIKLRQAEATSIADVTTATERRRLVTAESAKLRNIETAAIGAGLTAISAEASAAREANRQYIEDLQNRGKEITRVAKEQERAAAQAVAQGKTAAGQLRFARRGIAATALSLLGIRGATLASTGAFLAGAAGATLFALSVKSAVDLEQELNVFQQTAGATADQMERVRATAEQLGRDIRLPGISAADAAVAMTSLAKAGLSVQDSITGATGVLQLAIAANIDLARSTEIVASALNAFGLSGNQATMVADVLANSANLAQGSIDDMGIAMQQAAAVGRQAGLSFQDTATFLTILARAGLRGSDAGTSLRTGLIRLINPSEKAKKILDELGVSIRDAEGNIRPEVFQNLAAATAGMSKAQRDQTIAQLAGNDAVRAFSIIMRLSLPDLLKFREENRKVGSAAALTEARAKGLAGAARGLASNLQTTGIAIGRSATPALHGFVTGLNDVVVAASESASVSRVLSDSLNILGNTVYGLKTAFSALLPIWKTFMGAQLAVAQSIGFGPLLAGLAAFKLFKPTVGALAVTFGVLKERIMLASTAFSIARANTTRFGAAAVGLSAALKTGAASANVWLLAATALAVGLTYVLSRETALERATRSLKDANDALVESINRRKSAVAGLADAERGTVMARRALDTAKEAEAVAKLAVQQGFAARGTQQYTELLNGLKRAQQDVMFAEGDLGAALQREIDARAENEAAARTEQDARRKEAQSIRKVIDAEQERIRQLARSAEARARATRQQTAGGLLPMALPSPEVPSNLEQEVKIREEIIQKIRKQAETLKLSEDATKREIGFRLSMLTKLIEQTKKVPDQITIDALITTKNLRQALAAIAPAFGVAGKEATKAFVQGWIQMMPGQIPKISQGLREFNIESIRGANSAGLQIGQTLGERIRDALANAKNSILQVWIDILNSLATQAAKFAEQEDLLTIAMGGRVTPKAELALKQRQKTVLENTLAALQGKANLGPLSKEEKALRAATRSQLAALLREIAGIEDQMVADAKTARSDAESKAQQIASDLAAAGQAFVEKLTLKQQPLLRAQERAGLTESLTDDIKINLALQKLYKKQINAIRANVKDKETRNAAIRDLQAKSFQLDLDLNRLLAQQAERQKQLVRERFQLDIEFFQTTENRRGEINARKRFIAYLKRLQKETREGTMEWRRLRNEIAAQEKELKDLKAQDKKRKNAWAELTWQFMQTQQGFAANLLGNLIPLGASHNLVGNISTTGGGGGILGGGQGQVNIPGVAGSAAAGFGGGLGQALINQPDRRLLQAQGRAAGAAQPPMGRDQASIEIQILHTIASILARMERGARHPEARRSQVSQNAAYETVPHGAMSDP